MNSFNVLCKLSGLLNLITVYETLTGAWNEIHDTLQGLTFIADLQSDHNRRQLALNWPIDVKYTTNLPSQNWAMNFQAVRQCPHEDCINVFGT